MEISSGNYQAAIRSLADRLSSASEPKMSADFCQFHLLYMRFECHLPSKHGLLFLNGKL